VKNKRPKHLFKLHRLIRLCNNGFDVFVKHRNLQESSVYVPQHSRDSKSLERRVQVGGNDVDQVMDDNLSLDDCRVDQQDTLV